MTPILAYIVPLTGGEPGYPAHPIMGPGVPTHPIMGPGYPAHPIMGPGYPAHPIMGPGVPTPPIYYPPTVWPGPGHPSHPIYYPPGNVAVPPIYNPIDPGYGQPTPPDAIWGGRPPAGYPTPPIYYPPTVWPKPPGDKPPVGIWPPAGVPTPPIYYPPEPTPPSPGVPEFPIGSEGWTLRYVPGYGWLVVPPADWTPDKPTGPPPTVQPIKK